MKLFNVTFSELKKYNPITRTLKVSANNKSHARMLIAGQFGTCKTDIKTGKSKPTGKRIVIQAIVPI